MEDDRIVVCVRVRPPIGNEAYAPLCLRKAQNGQTVVLKADESTGYVNGETSAQFQFDHVFDETDNQEIVYEECVQEMVDSALGGCNSTVFAYGQTGSGKTFTILGDTSSKSTDGKTQVTERSGVFMRVFDDLFRYRSSVQHQIHIKITLSIIEIYVDDVLDLLANKNKLKLRDSGEETFALGITTVEVNSIDDVLQYFRIANEFRSVTTTKMNESSSRSHALFFIDLYQFPVAQFPTCPALSTLLDANALPIPQAAPGMVRSRISLIDLAGSERVKKSGVTGQAMTEAQAINKSLSTLGTVINAMYTKNPHIPFRESKLTRLLKPSFLQANSRLLLIGQASPPSSSGSESLGTLRFCDRVKGLQAPETPAFLDPQEEERFLKAKKENHEICADLRILTAMHHHPIVHLKALAAAKGTSAEAERPLVEAALRQNAPLRAKQAEDLILSAFQTQLNAEKDKEVESFIIQMNARIEEYEAVASKLKSEKKTWKKQKEELEAQVEASTHEAKKGKKVRVKLQEQLIALRDAPPPADPTTIPGHHGNAFDEPDATTGATGSAAEDGDRFTDAYDEQLLRLVEDYGRLGVETGRVVQNYITRLTSTRQCRFEVRRMKMRSSAIVSEGTTVDDLIGFMIQRAVDISEGNVPEKMRWTWKEDVDGISKKLKDATELYPPLLLRPKPNMYRRPVPSTTQHHKRTFISSDDSDEDNSHYPAETRRRRNMNGVPGPSGEEELIVEDMDDLAPTIAPAPKPAVSTPAALHTPAVVPAPVPTASVAPPLTTGVAEEISYQEQLAEEQLAAGDEDGSSVASEEDVSGRGLASPIPVVQQTAWGDEPTPVAVPANPVPAVPPRVAAAPPPVPGLSLKMPVILPAAAAGGGGGISLPIPALPSVPVPVLGLTEVVSNPAPGTIEGGERRRHRRHRRRDTAEAEEKEEEEENAGAAAAGMQPVAVTITKGTHQALSDAHAADEDHSDEGEEESRDDGPKGLAGGKSISGMIDEMRRRKRKKRSAVPAEDVGSPNTTMAVSATEEGEGAAASARSASPEIRLTKEQEDRLYLMQVYDSPTLVSDLVKFLRGGTVMLKHGRIGKPHRRLFWVSSARGKPELLWMDPDARNAERSNIKLDDVAFIKLGSFSKVFKRHPVKPPSDAFFRCFTIGLKRGGRTVDIVADTVADYEAWVVGLSWMIGVDPCWGGKPDITKEKGFDQLTFFESNLCESNYVMPMDYLALKKEVQRRVTVVQSVVKRHGNQNLAQAQRELGMFHPPRFNEHGALYLSKGELRFLLPELKLDIFRISFIWIQFEQLNLVYDPHFVPATSFGVTFRE